MLFNDLLNLQRKQVVGDIGTVGITQHAADALGDVVYVELPSKGTAYTAGSSFGSVESVKAASDVYAPVAGEVIEVNEVCSFLLPVALSVMNDL